MKHFTKLVLIALSLTSCDEDWLEVKRDRALIVPSTLNDMRLMLRDEVKVSRDNNNLIQISGDDYYIPYTNYQATNSPIIRNTYVWASDIYEGMENVADWDQAYEQILVANVVLDGLKNIARTPANEADWNMIKGGALHLRGKALFILAQTFAPQFDPNTASADQGIPVRTVPDVNLPTVRGSVQEVYDQITADLEEAAQLLPATPEFIMDPSEFSARGWLARTYLVMNDYEKALEHSNAYLVTHDVLIDYNTLNPGKSYPLPRYNSEVIQHSETSLVYGSYTPNGSRIPDDIYNLFDANDLRKTILFRNMGSGELGTYAFRGSYTGGVQLFSGIATNEMYLVRAECHARLGDHTAAMDDLNTLLESRWLTGTFTPFTAPDAEAALDQILQERRKELLRRGLRWSDLRRLNKDPNRAMTIMRIVNGVDYILPPGDPKYVLPIPEYVIEFSGIQQNPR